MNREIAMAIGLAGNRRQLALKAGLPVRTVYWQINRGYFGPKQAEVIANRFGLDAEKLRSA